MTASLVNLKGEVVGG